MSRSIRTVSIACLLAAAAIVSLVAQLVAQQGMGGGSKAAPRGPAKARTGLPNPKIDFRDIAAAAGLAAPNVYG
ncbi:MAG: hypothetical protein ACR2I2_08305, partial [Bryobacteraceae bacterium]